MEKTKEQIAKEEGVDLMSKEKLLKTIIVNQPDLIVLMLRGYLENK